MHKIKEALSIMLCISKSSALIFKTGFEISVLCCFLKLRCRIEWQTSNAFSKMCEFTQENAFSSYKKRFIRNNTLNFGPLETQTLRSYFLKKREPQNLRKTGYFWQKI